MKPCANVQASHTSAGLQLVRPTLPCKWRVGFNIQPNNVMAYSDSLVGATPDLGVYPDIPAYCYTNSFDGSFNKVEITSIVVS